MNNFRDAVDYCGLKDLNFEGYEFTYDNGQVGSDNRQSRIDRAMVNDGWAEMFPAAKLVHMDREWSDHAPLVVWLDGRRIEEGSRQKRFRFEEIWIGEDGCEDTIRGAWQLDCGDVIDTISRCA
ncbi:uncharacterized protein LOC141654927 [Silene latifolia]|uniref:uncharacterized protein LOC141654927 n=1 Tax=Silene latifolia TaxID=37657 RepID=UPI003D76B249